MTADPTNDMRIAVIGMSGRFPGAPDIESFWQMICAGREGVRDFSDDELAQNGASEEELSHPRFVRRGAPLDDYDQFDARYFGVTPRDAELMDPQHRILLEVSHAALEDAGYGAPATRPLTGVFVGSSMSHYAFQIFSQGGARGPMASLPAQIGNGDSHLATRISYKLDLHGPSLFVQTACSTSLTAIHLACRSLLSYECDMALAGGSSLTMPYPAGYVHMEGGMLSADGRCRPFDAQATGTVIGNGAAAVILKRYSDALRDGDTIHALVLGSAINNDGADRAGYTAPSRDGQVKVVAEALGIADVPARTIGLVEAHGTGTIIGDPIEIDSLSRAYQAPPGTTWIGSVKSNVGHMLAAAGVAAFIKTVLALSRQTIPPSANFESPNPHIDFQATPFRVAATQRSWDAAADHPRRASVSSFGIGGSNAHIILEEAPPTAVPAARIGHRADGPGQDQLIPVSAATPEALRASLAALAHSVPQHQAALDDIAWTLQAGRREHSHRAAIVAGSHEEAAGLLRDWAERTDLPAAGRGGGGFLFPGQGMQRAGMFRALFEAEGPFRTCLLAAAQTYAAVTGDDLLERIYGAERDDAALTPTQFAQPALFAVEYALARQFMDWGFLPGIVLGHSVGDFAAAAVAGILSAEDAMRTVAKRGALMQAQAPGAMYAVSAAEADLADLLDHEVVLAAINAPSRSVLALPEARTGELEARLTRAKLLFQRLRVSHAFHSPMMEPAAAELAEFLRGIDLSRPVIPMISSATGATLTDAEAIDPAFWASQIVRPVRFLDGLRTLGAAQTSALIEAGPGDALSGFGRSVLPSSSRCIPADPGRRRVDDLRSYIETLGEAWCAGANVAWHQFNPIPGRSRVSLPTYQHQRQRFWIAAKAESNGNGQSRAPADPGIAKRAQDVADWFYLPSWRRTVAPARLAGEPGAWLMFVRAEGLGPRLSQRLVKYGHRVVVVYPGADFTREGDQFTIRPDATDDYRRLLQEIGAVEPDRIVHAWGLGAAQDAHTEKLASFISPMLLAQAIGHAGIQRSTVLTILAEGSQRVGSADMLTPERALGIGPARVIGQEFGTIESRHVDIVGADWLDGSSDDRLDSLLGELAGSPPPGKSRARDQHRIVALRGQDRWIQTFEQVSLPSAEAIPPGGVHVITGGLGGIGSVIAEAIAAAGPCTLVLTTRSDTIAASTGHAALLSRIERAGSVARIVQLDPTDQQGLSILFKQLTDEFGDIASIVHAAGAPGAGMIQLKTVDVANQVLGPKYEGTLAIEAALEDAQASVKLLLLCSSLTSVRGGFGQVDYCAANAFLDAYAQAARSRRIGDVVSVNWGAWAEVGMAVASIQKFGFIPCPFWLRSAGELGPALSHPLLDRVVTSPDGERAVRVRLDGTSDWVIAEHCLRGRPTMPGTGHLELLRAASAELGIAGSVELAEVEFRAAASVAHDQRMELVVLAEAKADGHELKIVTRSGDGAGGAEVMIEHVRAQVRPGLGEVPAQIDLDALRKTLRMQEAKTDGDLGAVQLGEHWQIPGRTLVGDGESLVELQVPAAFAAELDQFVLHPSLLDVALGAARLAVGSMNAMLPFGYHAVRIFADRLPPQIFCHARRVSPPGAGMAIVDAQLLDDTGRVLVDIVGYRLRQVDPGANPAGDADAHQAAPQQVADALAGAILSHEGASAFLTARSAGERQLVISPLDLDAVVAKWQADERSMVERVAKADLSRGESKPTRTADGASPSGQTESTIAAIWQELLGYSSVPRDADFFELGGDSLLGIQLHNRLQEAFGITITLAAVFENPTVSLLAELVGAPAESAAADQSPSAPIPVSNAASAAALLAEFEK